MHAFSGDTGPKRVERGLLAGHGDLVDRRLVVGGLADPEGAVEAQFEAVEIGHPAEAQEDRFAPPHDPGRGTVMGFHDVPARGHDLQEMGVGRHVGIIVMGRQKLGRLAGARLRGGQRDLVFRHPVADGRAACRHHRARHLARVAGQLQFLRGLDHAHVCKDGGHAGDACAGCQLVHIGAHEGRHVVGLDTDAGGPLQRAGQFRPPLRAHAVVPGGDPVDAGRGQRGIEVDRGGDQQALPLARDHEDGGPPEFHVQVVVIAGQVIDVVVICDEGDIEPRRRHAGAQGLQAGFEKAHGSVLASGFRDRPRPCAVRISGSCPSRSWAVPGTRRAWAS